MESQLGQPEVENAAQDSEFERTPVPERAHLGLGSFVGMYAGEHCAGTELMIGPLFVAAGVSAWDLVAGLFLGNLLAVLSWMFLTAPIATRARLTLYYQLEQICGIDLVRLYNLANGVMFCFLAGSMVTVSATALGVWFNFPMPGLNDLYPNSLGWVIAVLVIGGLISIVAALGYNVVAKFANIAAPWMVLVFALFGLVGLRNFVVSTGADVNTLSDVWKLCETSIWTGGAPLPGQVKFTFWHVMFFAWFCNMAMHIGMSDLTVFRYAKKSWYAIATSAGMYVGHFMAWIAAAMLFAYELHETKITPAQADLLIAQSEIYEPTDRDRLLAMPLSAEVLSAGQKIESDLGTVAGQRVFDTPTPLPGPLANKAAGLAGLLCVIIAGWTTANPTIYRAGLAFQAMIPGASRFWVTLATGGLATLAGMFPAIAMKLLGFVALYGLVLMPMGAVVFIDFWMMPKFGLKSNWAQVSGSRFNVAAGYAWLLTIGLCLALVYSNYTLPSGFKPFELYFVALPGWFIAAGLYVLGSAIIQFQLHQRPGFRALIQIIGYGALVVLTMAGVWFYRGQLDQAGTHHWFWITTIVWFLAAPLWMIGRAK